MAQEIINYGTTANDGTGDPLRTAFIKTDNNFDQIWAAGPVGSNISIINNTVGVSNTNGNLILSPNGIGVIQTKNKLVPSIDNSYDLGAANLRYRSAYIGQGGITVSGNLSVSGITQLSTYTSANIANIVGSVGQMVAISDSPTVGGRLAFWDTTNSRWSYVSDNSAV